MVFYYFTHNHHHPSTQHSTAGTLSNFLFSTSLLSITLQCSEVFFSDLWAYHIFFPFLPLLTFNSPPLNQSSGLALSYDTYNQQTINYHWLIIVSCNIKVLFANGLWMLCWLRLSLMHSHLAHSASLGKGSQNFGLGTKTFCIAENFDIYGSWSPLILIWNVI